MIVVIVFAAVIVTYAIGYALGYALGKSDGEDIAARWYEGRRARHG